MVVMCGLPGSGKSTIESHGCQWELIHRRAGLDTLRRRPATRNDQHGANSVTVSGELLLRYFTSSEEPDGEGGRVLVQK